MGTIAANYPMLGPLPESDTGNLVVANYFTRYTYGSVSSSKSRSFSVASKLVDEIFLSCSVPEQFHFYQGRKFESQLTTEVCKLLNINKLEPPLTIPNVIA